MDFDGHFAQTSGIGDLQHNVQWTDCHCYINDTFEQLAARWGKGGAAAYAQQKERERAKRAKKG